MSQRPRSSSLTWSQVAILIVAAVLGILWVILGAAFVLTTGFQTPAKSAQAQENREEPVQQPVPTLIPTQWVAAQPAQTPVPPTACAQHNQGAVQVPAALVLDDGSIEVTLDGEVVQVSLASIRLPADAALIDQTVQHARALFTGQTVMLVKDQSEQDDAGRPIRYVFAGGQFVNYELVRQGLANAVLDSPDPACVGLLRQAELQARGDQLGMWNPAPVPTATFMPFVTLDPDQAACDCSIRYNCSDFTSRSYAQVCYNACNDYHSRLDLDRDGLACEGLP